MGNCLVIQQDSRKEMRVMRVDGNKVLEMPSSQLKVQQEALADPLTTGRSIVPGGVLPADPGAAGRVKLVISKQELKRMLDREGMSLDDMVSAMRKEAIDDRGREHGCCGRGWRPNLESIPEGTGF